MTVSIVIPTYNRARLLRRALISVLRQKYSPNMVIISDNASEDNTADVVREFGGKGLKINYHRHNVNRGMLKNWHHAIDMVDTNYFLVLADDDYLLPNCLEVGMKELHKDPNIGLFCGVTIALNESYEPSATAPSNLQAIGEREGFDLLTYMLQHPGSTGSIISKRFYDKAGGFREQSGYLADLSIMLRVSAISKTLIVDEPVAIYSSSGTYSKGVFFNRWYPGCLDIFEELEKLGVSEQFAYKRYVARTLFLSIIWLIKSICANCKELKENCKLFNKLLKYVTLSTIFIMLFEGLRMVFQGLEYKVTKHFYHLSRLDGYCSFHLIAEQVAKANTELLEQENQL